MIDRKVIISILVLLIVSLGFWALYKNYPKAIIPEAQNQISTSVDDKQAPEKINPVFKEITKEEYARYKVNEQDTATVCTWNSDFNLYRNCREKDLLVKYPAVSRTGDCLIITLISGDKKEICDVKSGDPYDDSPYNDKGEAVRKYTFSGYVPTVGALFDVVYYEGGAKLAVNEKTGEEMQVLGTPVLSPHGSKFVAVNSDIEAGYTRNGFQLWQKKGDSFVLSLEYYLDGELYPEGFFGMSDAAWVDEHTFYFIKNTLNLTSYGSYSF